MVSVVSVILLTDCRNTQHRNSITENKTIFITFNELISFNIILHRQALLSFFSKHFVTKISNALFFFFGTLYVVLLCLISNKIAVYRTIRSLHLWSVVSSEKCNTNIRSYIIILCVIFDKILRF